MKFDNFAKLSVLVVTMMTSTGNAATADSDCKNTSWVDREVKAARRAEEEDIKHMENLKYAAVLQHIAKTKPAALGVIQVVCRRLEFDDIHRRMQVRSSKLDDVPVELLAYLVRRNLFTTDTLCSIDYIPAPGLCRVFTEMLQKNELKRS